MVKIYEFVCRHFLAACSLPAIAHKTKVEIEMGGETFRATGIMIKAGLLLSPPKVYE